MSAFQLAARQGIEPQPRGSEPRVLPVKLTGKFLRELPGEVFEEVLGAMQRQLVL